MVPLLMLFTACDTETSANGIKYHSHAALLFSCLDLRNAMVPLMVLSRPLDAGTNAGASRDSNTNASGIM